MCSFTTDNGSSVSKIGKSVQKDARVKEASSDEILSDHDKTMMKKFEMLPVAPQHLWSYGAARVRNSDEIWLLDML